ncbi:hypothetical protein FFI89_001960 [Bradyrhizobium sp. KBS0727]|uniref:hypothetical protein n=1 Tax=unclassified Bradyrhizobium TaxID=2631580 RepID=UPI00110D5A65|nr:MULTISPECIES: hypothetical protein [unclassified Bradyrhizobium]QDW41753.1 hypothetical protein FFI71_001960 [Bradyrhizobium sp. KBS0725]QDW48362.1 hypothetical protein FFI89_001960 [Bradyrhizobium sp. KBS0727]
MHSFPAPRATSNYTTRIHPALTSFADEVCATLARLCAYVMMLALIAIGAFALWDQLPDAAAAEPPARDAWSVASRAVPAFAVSQFIFQDKTEVYEILRHPEGGRKDVFHWSGTDNKPVAELELYHPGGELHQAGPAIDALAARMDPDGALALEAAGVIDSKFGPVTLLRLIGGADDARACLGFMKRIDDPNFRISGWSCQGDNKADTLPARRAAIGCILNRLMLLTAGNEPKLAELFTHAELRRSDCTATSAPALSADWLTGADNPRLRGAL